MLIESRLEEINLPGNPLIYQGRAGVNKNIDIRMISAKVSDTLKTENRGSPVVQ